MKSSARKLRGGTRGAPDVLFSDLFFTVLPSFRCISRLNTMPLRWPSLCDCLPKSPLVIPFHFYRQRSANFSLPMLRLLFYPTWVLYICAWFEDLCIKTSNHSNLKPPSISHFDGEWHVSFVENSRTCLHSALTVAGLCCREVTGRLAWRICNTGGPQQLCRKATLSKYDAERCHPPLTFEELCLLDRNFHQPCWHNGPQNLSPSHTASDAADNAVMSHPVPIIYCCISRLPKTGWLEQQPFYYLSLFLVLLWTQREGSYLWLIM